MEPKSFSGLAHKRLGALLMEDSKLMEILSSYYVVRLNGDEEFSEKLNWCMEHCSNKFRDIREPDCRAWYFQNEHDATLFAMKWAG